MSETVIESPPMDGTVLEKELTRINKRHMARLLDLLSRHGELTPTLRADIVRSFNFLLEDSVVAARMETDKENTNERQADFHTNPKP